MDKEEIFISNEDEVIYLEILCQKDGDILLRGQI